MKSIRLLSLALLLLVCINSTHAQNEQSDSLSNQQSKFSYKPLLIPSALILYGCTGFESDGILNVNRSTKTEMQEHIDRKITIDDFSQYSPMGTVFILNLSGIEGRHRFKERLTIYATAYLIMGTTVLTLKNLAKFDRPDGSSTNSFPSGHTATAFLGAEFLWQEFKDKSVWIGIAGYTIAAGTGFFRMYNNRHWLTDVAAGAGIGMLSTKIAYWLHPCIQRTFLRKKSNGNAILIPYTNGETLGLNLYIAF